MITQKKQTLRRASYIGLSFFSLMILFDAQAKNHTSLYSEEADETSQERRNRIAAKWGLAQRSAAPSYQGPTLCGVTEEYRKHAIELKEKIKDEREESNALKTHLIEGGAAVANHSIDSNVKDEPTKTVLHQLVDEAVGSLKSFF